MKNNKIFIISLLVLFILVGTLLVSCSTGTNTTTSSGGTDGQSLLQSRCADVCHGSRQITSAHMTQQQWDSTVQQMINRGASLNPTEKATLVTYLAENYK